MRTHGGRGRDESDAAMSQGTGQEPRTSKRQGRIFLERLLREHGPANTLVLESGDLGLSE